MKNAVNDHNNYRSPGHTSGLMLATLITAGILLTGLSSF
jgi:hypothetical protein